MFAVLGSATAGAALLENLAEAVGLPLLFVRELISLIGHAAEAAGILLALQSAQRAGGVAEAVSGAAGIGGALLLRRGAIERVGGFAERVDGLLDAGIAGGLQAIG